MSHCRGCWVLAGIHVVAGLLALMAGHAEGVCALSAAGVYGRMAQGKEG